MLPPILTKPPEEPLPDPSKDSRWYGEIWVKYPMSQSLSPIYFGQVFKAKCRFRIIMSEFCSAAYSNGVGVTLDKANSFYARLKTWYDDLPGPLSPKNIVLPAHLQLQYVSQYQGTMFLPFHCDIDRCNSINHLAMIACTTLT